MGWVSTVRSSVIAVLLVLGLTMVGGFAAGRVMTARGEALFISHVNEALPRGVTRQVPRPVLLAEGYRACAWLAKQPDPQGAAQSFGPSLSRFMRQVAPPTNWPFERSGLVRQSATYDAWGFLCPDVQEDRKSVV